MVLQPSTARPPVAAFFVGIGIRTHERSATQRHVALIYNPKDGSTQLSHLRGNYDFVDEPWDSSYMWAPAGDLDELERPTVVARLLALAKSKPNIPYGFRMGDSVFELNADGSLRYRKGAPVTGLTCSTFVVCFFASMHRPILDADTWPIRQEDVGWAVGIAAAMARESLDRDRLRAAGAAATDARIRPEELVAAYIQAPWPMDFTNAERVARDVIADLASVPPVQPPFLGRPGNPPAAR
jgi:hypothetical protein